MCGKVDKRERETQGKRLEKNEGKRGLITSGKVNNMEVNNVWKSEQKKGKKHRGRNREE